MLPRGETPASHRWTGFRCPSGRAGLAGDAGDVRSVVHAAVPSSSCGRGGRSVQGGQDSVTFRHDTSAFTDLSRDAARLRPDTVGGRGGIRTPGSLSTTPDFESGAFNHSATLPRFE